MQELSKKYKHKEAEAKWQKYWQDNKTYKFDWNDTKEGNVYSVDTPPPHVSGVLHMGHIFGYSQMDCIARYQRMKGMNVFYPVGYDDNGLPSEKYVEKKKKIKSKSMERGEFVKICDKEIKDAEKLIKDLFVRAGYSFDWDEEYRTISDMSRRVSQMSFIDLFNKGHLYQKEEPVIWDVIDQTSLAQTEAEDKEFDSQMNYLRFKLVDKDSIEDLEIMTTRPELLPACVAVFYHPDDKAKYEGKEAITPLGVRVPMIADESVEKDKGTGVMMCCTFGDHADVEKWKKYRYDYDLSLRIILDEKGLINIFPAISSLDSLKKSSMTTEAFVKLLLSIDGIEEYFEKCAKLEEPISNGSGNRKITTSNVETLKNGLIGENLTLREWSSIISLIKTNDIDNFEEYSEFYKLKENGIKQPKGLEWLRKISKEINGLFVEKARKKILELLDEDGKLTREPVAIRHTVKVGERSKYPVEILVKKQWSIKVLNIKEELHEKAREIKWHPEWMEARIHSWIDGLSWDWCISRQRFFGVPVPVWYSKRAGEEGKPILPSVSQLPVDPTADLPEGYSADEVCGETDVFDTWATSSISPQLSTWGVTEDLCHDKERFNALKMPFSLRAQGHDIIRTWAFCTIAKSYYHQGIKPWSDIMVNGFCLAEDGTKMSKSVGNVIDPVKVIDEFGTDAVRYWTSNSTLGTDTSFNKDIMKMGQKLVTKLWNCAKFGQMHFRDLAVKPSNAKGDIKNGRIYEQMDLWILSKLAKAVDGATKCFENFEYGKARDVVEDFFWNDFCDNYLEIAKIRCYGVGGRKYEGIELSDEQKAEIERGQLSGILAIYHCLNTILKLFAPFVPHVTEEIFSCLFEDEFKDCGSIHARGIWPKAEDFVRNEEAEKVGEVVVKAVADVRRYKSDNSLAMNASLEILRVSHDSGADLSKVTEDLKNVTAVTSNFLIIFPSRFISSAFTALSRSAFFRTMEMLDSEGL